MILDLVAIRCMQLQPSDHFVEILRIFLVRKYSVYHFVTEHFHISKSIDVGNRI